MKSLKLTLLTFLLLGLLVSVQAAPQKVKVGAYLTNVESIDLSSNTYYLQFLVWFKWKGSVDPTKSAIFMNLIDEWGLTKTPVYKTPKKTADGYNYQRFRVEGRFYHKFWLGTFPLDWQKVTFELRDGELTRDKLIYEPDTENSGVNPDLAIPGWRIDEVYNKEKPYTMKSDFGEGTAKTKEFSRYRFGIKIQRPGSFFMFKVVPPVLITLLCCLLVFLLDVAYVDARVSTAIGALLTEVFLQLSFTGNLPNVGIMLLIDHIFNYSYIIIFAILLVVIYTTNKLDEMEDLEGDIEDMSDGPEKDAANDKVDALQSYIDKVDRYALIALSVVFIIGIFVITYSVRGYIWP